MKLGVIYWTSDDCDGQVDLKLHLSVGQVILFPYFDHCEVPPGIIINLTLYWEQVSFKTHLPGLGLALGFRLGAIQVLRNADGGGGG